MRINWVYCRDTGGFHIVLNGEQVYFTKDEYRRDMFIAELKMRAAQQSVQADGAESAASSLVYKIEWVDADTIRLTPRR